MLKLLNHPEVTLSFTTLTNSSAEADWDDLFPPSSVRIHIDKNQFPTESNYIAAVIHELLHIMLSEMFFRYVDDKLEEIAVMAYEKEFEAFINKKPARLKAWQKAIEAKLKEPDGTTGNASIPVE